MVFSRTAGTAVTWVHMFGTVLERVNFIVLGKMLSTKFNLFRRENYIYDLLLMDFFHMSRFPTKLFFLSRQIGFCFPKIALLRNCLSEIARIR